MDIVKDFIFALSIIIIWVFGMLTPLIIAIQYDEAWLGFFGFVWIVSWIAATTYICKSARNGEYD